MHAVKKTLKIYKPTTQTRDSEFDTLYITFKDLAKHVQNMQQQYKASRTSWGSVNANSKEALQSVERAFSGTDSNSEAKEFATRGLDALVEWDQQNKDLRESSSDTRFKEADDMLNSYMSIIKNVSKQIDKRNDTLKEFDYYRGKVEELSAKDLTKDKDQERYRRAENEENRRRQEFDQLNTEVKVQMAKVVEQKRDVFMRALAAFMDVNRRIMSHNPFDTVLRDYEYILQGEWPPLEEYSPDFQPQFQAPPAHRGPSASSINVPPGSQPAVTAPGVGIGYVRALYDFVAENPEELSFKAGDRIELNEVLDDNWMHGNLNGRSGIFPCNYVERI